MMPNVSPPVIYYHSVAPARFREWSLSWLTLEMRFFEDQMRFLAQRGFRGLFLDEWLDIRQGRKPAEGPTVCLTFDDGLLDNWVYAYPLVKKYGLRMTIFVSPEFVDPKPGRRPNLEDVWAGRHDIGQLEARGYATWDELRDMQASGYVDIQSHTMSHTKYIAGPKRLGYYYGGHLGVYPILNREPDLKPRYFADPDFEKKLAWGTPLFEEASAVIVRRHTINPDAIDACLGLAAQYDLAREDQQGSYETRADALLDDYERRGQLVLEIENETSYRDRLHYEIVQSKAILEEQLGKPVRFMCWPHGDNNALCHEMARKAGYLATTSGKMGSEAGRPDRIPRLGAGSVRDNFWLSRQKFIYKLESHRRKQPYYALSQLNDLKNNLKAALKT